MYVYLQMDETTFVLRLRVIAGHELAKKDIFGAR
jgi:hypothetical protein